MNYWLNTSGYVAAALFALRGSLSEISDRDTRWKSLTLFYLALFLGIDAFPWFWAAKALADDRVPVGIYPPFLHIIDIISITAAWLAVAQLSKSKLTDSSRRLDAHAAWGISGFAVYAAGCVLYWIVMLFPFPTRDTYWLMLHGTWYIQGPLSSFALMCIGFYAVILLVAVALLFPHLQATKSSRHRKIRSVTYGARKYFWWYNRRVWPSLACWLAIPLACYMSLGPPKDILISTVEMPRVIVYSVVAICALVGLVGLCLGTWGLLRHWRVAARASRKFAVGAQRLTTAAKRECKTLVRSVTELILE